MGHGPDENTDGVMSQLPIDPLLMAVPPLAVAAGVDLYLTLLLIGAAPTLGLWPDPLPGALGDLDSPSVLITVGIFYVLEFTSERFPTAAIVWSSFHAIIRPVSGILLAMLVLDGEPLPTQIGGAAVAGFVTSMAHGMRSGAGVLHWLTGGQTVPTLLLSFAEDVVVIGIVSLTLDAPGWAFVLTMIVMLGASPLALSLVRAFEYAVLLLVSRFFVVFRQRRWSTAEELPAWVSESIEGEAGAHRAGALRGCPSGAFRLPGAPLFVFGWVVVGPQGPLFVFRRRLVGTAIDLASLAPRAIQESALFRRIDLSKEGRRCTVFFGVGGPGVESLSGEFPPRSA
jgi:hypothetical protein